MSIVLVSHSSNLATGVADVATAMAPDVEVVAVGGTRQGALGTSYDDARAAVSSLRQAGHAVLLLSDLGSAAMVAEMVAEEFGQGVDHAVAPFVEGAVAAAVCAQGGADLAAVATAATDAGKHFLPVGAGSAPVHRPAPEPAEEEHVRHLVLHNTLGLHARPAAIVARIAADYDAKVWVNDTDATSVLALMGLALPGGAEVTLRASGRQAREVLMALVPHFDEGFGEE